MATTIQKPHFDTINVVMPTYDYWRIAIEGDSPLLTSYMKFNTNLSDSPQPTGTRHSPEEEARGNVRYNEAGQPSLTGEAIFRCLTYTAKFFKANKGRGSLKTDATVAISVLPSLSALLPIQIGDRAATKDDFELDIRTAVPPNQGKIVRGRPRFDTWGLRFDLQIDPDIISPKILPQLVATAGYRSGLGDFRPSSPHGGPYGRFHLTEFIHINCFGEVL